MFDTPTLKTLLIKHRGIFEIKSANCPPWADTSEIIMLPLSFDDMYKKFLLENQKMINELSRRYDCSTSRSTIKALYCYTNGA